MSNGLTRTFTIQAKAGSHLAEKIAPYVISVFVGFCIADLAVQYLRSYMIPLQAPPARPVSTHLSQQIPRSQYGPIISRNIFNSQGLIPDAIGAGAEGRLSEQAPVPSQLPLALIGTIVLSNPDKSIATIQVRGKGEALAFVPNRDIDQIATLIRVERNKIILRNRNNGRLEYIENKADTKVSFGAGKGPASGAVAGPANVKLVGDNKFELTRQEVNKFTSDLSSLVMQASTIPRRKSNGEIDGFTITAIQPNSVFSQLGFQPMDTIKSVNGEPIDSPAKAIELYNALKNTPGVKVTVERDGRDVDFEFAIK